MIIKDPRGIVCQKNGVPGIRFEGGDSLNWTAHYLFFADHTYQLKVLWFLNMFECFNGHYVRHPNPLQSKYGWASYCEGNWRGVESRDQMTGKLCYLALAGAKKALRRCLKEHYKRFMLFANNSIHNGDNPEWYALRKHKLPDITGPAIWAIYIRGLRKWSLYPLLLLFDLQLVVDGFITMFRKDNDVINHVIEVVLARKIMPTPFSVIASKFSTAKRMKVKLINYWAGWRQQPGMYQLYVPYIDKYWK